VIGSNTYPGIQDLCEQQSVPATSRMQDSTDGGSLRDAALGLGDFVDTFVIDGAKQEDGFMRSSPKSAVYGLPTSEGPNPFCP